MPLCIEWRTFFQQLYDVQDISFPRCYQPSTSLGKPVLIVFDDGSKEAFGAVAYARWEVTPKCFWARLIMAKCRVAPMRAMTIPRLELAGAVIGVRLRETIESEVNQEFDRVLHITDSQIVRCQIQKESHGFRTFTANRIAEIQCKSDPNEWWWVASENNPADMTTRPSSPKCLDVNSVWQNGPEYLRYDICTWPISQSISKEDLPDKVGVVMTTQIRHVRDPNGNTCVDGSLIPITRFSDLKRLLTVTAMVLKIVEQKTLKNARLDLTDYIKKAECFWIKYSQIPYYTTWKSDLKSLGPAVDENGIIKVGKRLTYGVGKGSLPMIIPCNCPFAKLYCNDIHNEDHAGVDTTIVKVRARLWIPKIRRLVKDIKNKCVICRYLAKCYMEQEMGPLPEERVRPSRAFHHSAIDLFGPFNVKDMVKKRTCMKAYGVIFNCLYSRAVYLDLVEGYDTRSFMLALKRFTAIRGYPGTIRSDRGSQLISASKELKEVIENGLDWKTIYQFGEHKQVKWLVNKSADAPWENGCSESLIKSVKRCLNQSVGTSVLTFAELQTALFEISSLLNDRPIGTKTTDPDEGAYLCPNDLLLGGTNSSVPHGTWDNSSNSLRLQQINEVAEGFWRKWTKYYFPSLLVRKRWHTQSRNLCVGDVVLMQPDSNDYRGVWKLAQVSKADTGSDNMVRNVVIRYKQQGPGHEYKGVQDTFVPRSVHRLILILPVEEQPSEN